MLAPSLPKLYSGKVRDLYEIDAHTMLMVASDRLSAFDVVFADPIPGKGAVLTQLSTFWFQHFVTIPHHLSHRSVHDVLPAVEADALAPRAVVVKRLQPVKIEAVVRGYLVGSGWSEYQRHGSVSGHRLPAGLQLASALPEPLFTPSTKADVGDHDQAISYQACENLIGTELASKIREAAITLYQAAYAYALERGIIIADTKFEFGLDAQGTLTLMDEILTPDSSRFWPRDQYRVGVSPPSFDKQFVRDWLEQSQWNKQPPPPRLPAEIIAQTYAKYRQAQQQLMG